MTVSNVLNVIFAQKKEKEKKKKKKKKKTSLKG